MERAFFMKEKNRNILYINTGFGMIKPVTMVPRSQAIEENLIGLPEAKYPYVISREIPLAEKEQERLVNFCELMEWTDRPYVVVIESDEKNARVYTTYPPGYCNTLRE